METAAIHQQEGQALSGIRPAKRPDATEVEAGIRRYCRQLRATASDTVAAINYGLQAAGDTFSAVRAGRRRAAQLHARTTQTHPPTKA